MKSTCPPPPPNLHSPPPRTEPQTGRAPRIRRLPRSRQERSLPFPKQPQRHGHPAPSCHHSSLATGNQGRPPLLLLTQRPRAPPSRRAAAPPPWCNPGPKRTHACRDPTPLNRRKGPPPMPHGGKTRKREMRATCWHKLAPCAPNANPFPSSWTYRPSRTTQGTWRWKSRPASRGTSTQNALDSATTCSGTICSQPSMA